MTPNYLDQLKLHRWWERRRDIMQRDGLLCQKCGCSGYTRPLQVHHLQYRLGLAPWEYRDDEMTTLCVPCHRETHRTSRVPILDRDGNPIPLKSVEKCIRCSGPGYIPAYHHVMNGICFRCWGSGVDFPTFFGRLELKEKPAL